MKDFHRSFICRSTETGKKSHKSKHNSNKNEICKCYAPFLKLHYYDCPVAKKPCPIHGSPYRHCIKDEKTEKKENMVISFHPSSKTEKLFRPVKNLLAHCNPETKINLEYYALNDSVTKNGIKHRQVQTYPEEFKKSLGSNFFVEKTKSFVTDKTNRMKRLKQCFHSPCNSIMARTKSEITIKNKMNENFCEIAKHAAVAANIPEEPSNGFLYEKSKWTSNKLDSSNWEKSSEDKAESDFLTVTKQVENKVIDHKIFEIKHKKGFGDIRFTKLPKQSPFVYASYDTEKTKNANADFSIQVEPLPNQKSLEKYSNDNEQIKKVEQEEISSSEKSQSSSSGSIYMTPVILVPPYMENDTSDESKYADDVFKERTKEEDEEIKTEDTTKDTVNKSVQVETSVLGKTIYESSSTSEDSVETKSFASKNEPISLKQEKGVGSGSLSSSDKYIITPKKSPSHSSKKSWKKGYLKTDISQTATFKAVNKSTQVSPSISHDLFDSEFYNKKEKTKPAETITILEETRKRLSPKTRVSSQVQTDSIQKREISLLYDGMRNVADKLTQTEPVITKSVQVGTMAAKKNKSEMTYWTAVKSVQTSFTLSDSQSQSQEGEFTDAEPHTKYDTASYTRPDPNREGDKSSWKKSHSDGDLYSGQKSNPESENMISIHHICLCENSETSTSDSDYNSYVKIGKPEESDTNPVVQNQNERRSSTIKKDTLSKGEQTSLSDLSELARMVDHFFDKMSREAFKSCDCEKIKRRDSKFNEGIADSSKSVKEPKRLMVDAKVQTTFKVILDLSPEEDKTKESSKKNHQSINLQDNGENIFVCKICRRKINTVNDNESLEKVEASKKEVVLRSTGTSTNDILRKRSIGICVPDDCTAKCFGKKRPLCMSQYVSTNDMHYASATKSPPNETRNYLENFNKETIKDCSVNTTSIKCPMTSDQFVLKPEDDPEQTLVEKEPVTNNQTKEKKSIRQPQASDHWKYANSSVGSETFERRSISKPSDASKTKLEVGKFRSGIPTAANCNRKNLNFKDKKSDEGNLNAKVIFMQCPNKPTFSSQKDSYASRVSCNRNKICIYSDISSDKLGKPKPGTECTNSKFSRASDQKPPLPKKPQPGGSNARRTRRNSNATTSKYPENPSNEKKFVFPAIIKPIRYKDFRKTLQMIKNCKGLHESKSSILKQKRLWEEDDVPGGKKIKGRENGSGESSEFEQSIRTSNGRQIIDMKENTDFVWVSSSARQLPKAETRSKSFLKGTQSESKVERNCSQNSTLIKGFNKRSANVLSVKSCRLKPVQVNEKHPFRKLFECRLCKSLNFLKTDQKNAVKDEQLSEDLFAYEFPRGKDEIVESCEPENWVFTPQPDEEFVVEYPFSSGSSNFDDSTENSDFVEDECEERNEETELSFAGPPGAEAEAFSNVTQDSQSFDLFWFGSGGIKK